MISFGKYERLMLKAGFADLLFEPDLIEEDERADPDSQGVVESARKNVAQMRHTRTGMRQGVEGAQSWEQQCLCPPEDNRCFPDYARGGIIDGAGEHNME